MNNFSYIQQTAEHPPEILLAAFAYNCIKSAVSVTEDLIADGDITKIPTIDYIKQMAVDGIESFVSNCVHEHNLGLLNDQVNMTSVIETMIEKIMIEHPSTIKVTCQPK